MRRTEGGGEEGPERPTLQLSGTMAEGEEEYVSPNGNRLSLNVTKTQSMTIAIKHKKAAIENQSESAMKLWRYLIEQRIYVFTFMIPLTGRNISRKHLTIFRNVEIC